MKEAEEEECDFISDYRTNIDPRVNTNPGINIHTSINTDPFPPVPTVDWQIIQLNNAVVQIRRETAKSSTAPPGGSYEDIDDQPNLF